MSKSASLNSISKSRVSPGASSSSELTSRSIAWNKEVYTSMFSSNELIVSVPDLSSIVPV